MSKRNFLKMGLEDTMPLIGTHTIHKWALDVPPYAPSNTLQASLHGLKAFDTKSTDVAKMLLMDILLLEIVPHHPPLKVWKGEELESATLTGFADYLVTPGYAYVKIPLLCGAQARRDNFDMGRSLCIAEMITCREKNQADGLEIDIFGFTSNGYGWEFYKLTTTNEVFETPFHSMTGLPRLLGALDYICAECAKRVP